MTMGKVGKERLKAVERNSFGPDLGEISLCVCVCVKVWRFRPQVCQERGHNSQCLELRCPTHVPHYRHNV